LVCPAGDTLPVRLTGAYSNTVVTNGSEALSAIIPIMLVPSYKFDLNTDWDWTAATSFVSQVQSVVCHWAQQVPPADQNAVYVFDFVIYPSQGQLQPLIQAPP